MMASDSFYTDLSWFLPGSDSSVRQHNCELPDMNAIA